MTRLAALWAVAVVLCTSCREEGAAPVERPPDCPAEARIEPPLRGVSAEERSLEYWLERASSYGPLDRPLLDAVGIETYALALQEPVDGRALGQVDLFEEVDDTALRAQVSERLAYLREKVADGTLVDRAGQPLSAEARRAFDEPPDLAPLRDWRLVEALTPLRCGPRAEGLYQRPVDPDFDRNLCSTLRPGEVVQLLHPAGDGFFLARTPYALGWVSDATLSQPLTLDDARASTASEPPKELTRRAVLTEAFSLLGEPYGWGGKDGGFDCSRFLLELFGRFGVPLPRHSARQAASGSFAVDVTDVDDRNEKLLLIEAAAKRGIVLLHFPGHIMLYLGTTEEGTPMVMHAFSEYVTPCAGTDLETVNRVDRVAISDLSLGADSSRSDFLDRITTITVVGGTPGPALTASATPRPSAAVTGTEGACRDSRRHALFVAPQRPHVGRPLRVIASSETDPGFSSLTLFRPDGDAVQVAETRLDGPPYSRVVEVENPPPGRWTAVLGEGNRRLACRRFTVTRTALRPPPREPTAPAWKSVRSWNRATENLYSAFVEQLFREPLDDDVTWPRLQELIGDPSRNLLHDYRLDGEDARLSLEPDCADLPYFLRAYFAWKLGLPFTYRTCTRGRKDTPPQCEPTVFNNLDPLEAATDVGAFRTFIRRMRGVVHSSSPRTLPDQDHTDFYPVRLSRTALRPGTVFADPYGHVLVVARWKPQGVADYGVLVGADAQPDGTVGRRRFWRGSFLFTPETDRVGAGFKRWRPVTIESEAGTPRLATNEELKSRGRAEAWSDRQYQGTADDFYSAIEGLINPRPLDPLRMQISLVDALEESVQRRLNSVDNGEAFMKSNQYATVEMPRGSALFLTSGPWEDFSTPSRDMRLLISIDAVTSFPKQVGAHPDRFGVRATEAETAAAAVEEVLARELGSRRFEYKRSDGTPWTLTLAELVARAGALEVAYNPNDCVEVRWGAEQGSDEAETCGRRAPADQQARMQSYRSWFAKRQRPQ